MTQSTEARWRTIERVERQGDEFLLQQKITVTESPIEEDALGSNTGFSVLPNADHRVIPLDDALTRDARENDAP